MFHPECEEKIRKSWTHAHISGSPMNRLFEKIKKCRTDLVAWSKSVFSNTRDRLNAMQTVLDELVQNGYEQNLKTITNLKGEINELLHHKEVF